MKQGEVTCFLKSQQVLGLLGTVFFNIYVLTKLTYLIIQNSNTFTLECVWNLFLNTR